jgi:hypothetical protein
MKVCSVRLQLLLKFGSVRSLWHCWFPTGTQAGLDFLTEKRRSVRRQFLIYASAGYKIQYDIDSKAYLLCTARDSDIYVITNVGLSRTI